jgi:hypothetical protein
MLEYILRFTFSCNVTRPKLALHLRVPLKRKAFHPWVFSNYLWMAEHKPLVVGLDIAKIAGRGESDSFIALRTW